MNVYLFELDSVRNSEAEIRAGQNALFREAVVYGNTVVMSLNQVVDSKAFWNGIAQDLDRQRRDESAKGSRFRRYAAHVRKTVGGERPYTDMLVELCEDGMIRIVRYGAYRTAAQYLLKKIEDCLDVSRESFHFSMMPGLEHNLAHLQMLRDTIQFSDLQRIEEQIPQAQDEDERRQLEFYYHYVRLILLMSQQSTAIAPPEKLVTLGEMLQVTKCCFSNPRGEIEQEIQDGCALLSALNQDGQELDRSTWYHLLSDYAKTNRSRLEDAKAAEAVLDLCYNHVLQENISQIDMRSSSEDHLSHRKVFYEEMKAYRVPGVHCFHCDADDSGLTREAASFNHREDKRWKRGCSLIDRNTNYLREKHRLKSEQKHTRDPQRYRKQRKRQKKWWARLSAWTLGRQLLVAGVYVLLFMLTNYAAAMVKNLIWPDDASVLPNLIDYLRGTPGVVVAALVSALVFRIVFVFSNMQGILVTAQSVFRALWENALLPAEELKEFRRNRKQR